MLISDKLKNLVRDFIPKKYQVAGKYHYNRLRCTLESEMRLLKYLVKRNDRVIDVGGNRGIYTYQLWKLGARVEVFEPNPACFSVLEAWAADKPAVNIHSVALSDNAGSATLHIPIDGTGVEHSASASIENFEFEHTRDQSVHLETLDSYNFENVSFIKIDVEGHEDNVIAGAAMLITSSTPALLVEIEKRHKSRPISEIFEKIMGFGYQGYFMDKGKLTALDYFDASRHQPMENFGGSKAGYINNFLFLSRDRLADGKYAAMFDNRLLS